MSETTAPPKQEQKLGNHQAGTQIAKQSASEIVSADVELPVMPDFSSLNDMKPGKSHVAKYRTQEDWQMLKDKPIKCFFLGTKEIPNDKDEAVKCAVFMEEKGIFLAAQKVLVDATKYLLYMSPIVITYKGKKKNASNEGSTNIFDLEQLEPSDKK